MAQNFVEAFLDYNSASESPTEYFKWCAYAVLAATLRDNCFIDLGRNRKIYPNLFVILLSKYSSLARKGGALRPALRLLQQVENTHLINGKSSIAGIIDELNENFKNSAGRIFIGASGIIYNEELTAAFVEEPHLVDTLTDWYDFHDNWGERLRGSGKKTLKRVCVSLLVGTNEESFPNFATSKVLYGGLLARSLLVYATKYRHLNSLEYEDKTQFQDDKHLVGYLRQVAGLNGEFIRTTEAKKTYDKWYHAYMNNVRPSATGVEGRIHTTIRKLSMIIAISQRPELRVEKCHVDQAIDECLELVKNYNLVTSAMVRSPVGRLGALILRELLVVNGNFLTRRELLQRFYGETDSETLDKTLQTFIEAGFLVTSKVGQDVGVCLTDLAKDKYSNKAKKTK